MRKEIWFIEISSLVWIWFSSVHCMSLLLVFDFKKGLFGIHRVCNQPILNTVYAIFFPALSHWFDFIMRIYNEGNSFYSFCTGHLRAIANLRLKTIDFFS